MPRVAPVPRNPRRPALLSLWLGVWLLASTAAAQPLSAAGGAPAAGAPESPAVTQHLLTQSLSTAVEDSLACTTGGAIAFYRVFVLEDLGIDKPFHTEELTFGVYAAAGVSSGLVRVHSLEGPFDPAATPAFLLEDLTLLASVEVTVEDLDRTLVTTPIEARIPAGGTLVAEVRRLTPDGLFGDYFVGFNTAGETARGFMAGCGDAYPQPVPVPEPWHFVLTLDGHEPDALLRWTGRSLSGAAEWEAALLPMVSASVAVAEDDAPASITSLTVSAGDPILDALGLIDLGAIEEVRLFQVEPGSTSLAADAPLLAATTDLDAATGMAELVLAAPLELAAGETVGLMVTYTLASGPSAAVGGAAVALAGLLLLPLAGRRRGSALRLGLIGLVLLAALAACGGQTPREPRQVAFHASIVAVRGLSQGYETVPSMGLPVAGRSLVLEERR